MSAGERFALSSRLVCADALLSEADGFDFSAAACDYDVGFGWVVGGAFRLIIACDSCSC